MFVATFAAGSFATNCHLLAPAPGGPCVVVDPGQQSARGIADLVSTHGLTPVAVLLTHGHMDHTWDLVPVARGFEVPAYVHPDDRFMVSAPARGLPDTFPAHVLAGHPNADPDDLRPLTGTLRLAGLDITVHHTAGHTPGSVLLDCTSEGERVLLTGDALLAGALGNTGSPGASEQALRAGLTRTCAPLPDDTVLLPGHGPTTTLGPQRHHYT